MAGMTDIEGLLAQFKEFWGDGLEASPENLHAAAVGLASSWYRNTEAVEYYSHARGPWLDSDMLRKNSWATELCRRSLVELAGPDDTEAEVVLSRLLIELCEMLPSKRSRESLKSERVNAPALAAKWIATNGLGNWLQYLVFNPLYPVNWWGSPGFKGVVEQFCAMSPGPPDLGTFRDRMVHEPWQLTDDQAEFVCTHRYDVVRES